MLAAVIVAEIGDIRRFPGPGQLGTWAGLTPRHYESDTKVSRGHITKQGRRMLRWAVFEAIQRQPAGTRPRQVKDGIIARRGKEAKNIAKVAAARELLTLVFYGMRDGHVRRALRPGRPHDLTGPAAGREAAVHSAPAPRGGAGAPVIDPARPGAKPPHAPRGHPGTNEGMNAASRLPGRRPAMGRRQPHTREP